MRRILLALVVLVGPVLVGLPSAPAAAAHHPTTSAALAAAPGGELPPHDVRWASRGKTGDKFWTRGRVVTWKNRAVTLQSARNRTSRWTAVKTGRTSARGVWRITFRGEVGRHYRVLIPAAGWAKATKIYVGKIVDNPS
ncbi:hypothetical protein DJ010_15690 [Nocardioides silvaticus]|uniref:Uncharacterized protein n=1 Tax=Nocardioides silvaticus TaxID=2201891 RepID=A0A316TDW4_9ACTN|nr:hypothetical protein [Nocardioides silvaticus]PWN01978.1 hypothetical protein DJ010_15690 [Nocardioides silvaticus]